MRLTKEQKGITLIALVITIIVLLILAGVALATLTGNGSIIDNANYAVTEYNKSAGNDQNVLNQVENLFAKYMGGSNNTGDDDDDDTPPAGPLLSTQVQPGDYITYNPELGVATADKATLLNYTSPVGTLKIKNSNNEYVVNEEGTSTYTYNGAYNLLNANGEFTLPEGYAYDTNGNVAGNGFGEQSFTAIGANIVWRVLSVTNGVVKIVPETPIQTTANADFYLKGLRGYKNAVTELNNISSIFGHGQGANGAESIKVEEVNALTGYTVTPPASTTALGSIGSWYSTYYYYEKDNSLADNIKSMIFKDSYWLASMCVSADSSYAMIFGVRDVYSDGVGSGNVWDVISSGGESNDDYYDGVLPVVSLRSDVVKLGGTGESGTPWTFQATE